MNKYRNETQRISWRRGSEPPAGDTWALIMRHPLDIGVDYLYAYSNPYMGFWEVRTQRDERGCWTRKRKVFWDDVYAWFPIPAPVNWSAVVLGEDITIDNS